MKKIIITLIITICFIQTGYSARAVGLEEATVKVAEDVGKSVVSISSLIKEKIGTQFYFGSPFEGESDDPFQRFFEDFFERSPEREYERMGLGSGVIIKKDGYILTNAHVVSKAEDVVVKLSDGREFEAEVTGIDPKSDLAVIKIEAENLPVSNLGDSSDLKIGNWVVAIGNPFGFAIENPEPTVTVGVVSALQRYLPALGDRRIGYDGLIQTDAAINPGNSGGPLVNLKGEVVGINVAILTRTGGYQGLGFAIPINKAKKIIDKLIKGQEVLYGWLGVSIQDLNQDLRNYFGIKKKEGVIIVKVYQDSPAKEAGLKEGDLILTYNQKSVKTTRDLVRMVTDSEVGQKANLVILRNGKEKNIDIKVGKRPEDIRRLKQLTSQGKADFRGMSVKNLNPYLKQKLGTKQDSGVVVVEIEDDSAAEASGLQLGDLIEEIENKDIKNIQDFKEVTASVKGSCLIKTSRGYIVLKE
ncbi:MAG: Do family serine endopeptidase [Candidatus Omnitrophica bacterium]|nr:Do family serine endopeptidase [Candidatus Omnitrophota bacterium]MCF7878420.1 Do family serine endopeptidase [Candidatus Omnitrophota bacterium]MCF7892935.1 Do family serine endopeptidase [Candidatus Omnitrophota bacterium]